MALRSYARMGLLFVCSPGGPRVTMDSAALLACVYIGALQSFYAGLGVHFQVPAVGASVAILAQGWAGSPAFARLPSSLGFSSAPAEAALPPPAGISQAVPTPLPSFVFLRLRLRGRVAHRALAQCPPKV